MLVLSRKPGETINIGDNISVTVVSIGPNRVRIGIDAPREVNVWRGELPELQNKNQVTPNEQTIGNVGTSL